MTRTRSFLRGSSPPHSNQPLFLDLTAGDLDRTCSALLCMLLKNLPKGFTRDQAEIHMGLIARWPILGIRGRTSGER